MYNLLSMYHVKIQAYHGGSMTGKDLIKVMSNAHEIFPKLAEIFEAGKKEDSMSKEGIDKLCEDTRELFVLWDGAFSYASKIDPTEHDILKYKQFVEAAVGAHMAYGCNVTPKVHLMWKHVAPQMKLSGGLGQKREDWVEKLHQIRGLVRKQMQTTKNMDQRALVMARNEERDSNPRVKAEMDAIKAETSMGKRKGRASVEEGRREAQVAARDKALSVWEAAKSPCPRVQVDN